LLLFTGYLMIDEAEGEVGIIQTIDNSTDNLLFEVLRGNTSLLVPAVDEWIVEIDDDNKILHIRLPEGLLQINDDEE